MKEIAQLAVQGLLYTLWVGLTGMVVCFNKFKSGLVADYVIASIIITILIWVTV